MVSSLLRPFFITFLLTNIWSAALYANPSSDIETITISANRQAVRVQEASSNIAWLDEEQLVLISPQHIQQALSRIAGVWVSRGNGQEHLTALRSPVLTGAGGCGAFFMAEDGISLRAPGFCNANQLFDANSEQAKRIEVVKGANSALYGSNAVHGVINILSFDAKNPPSNYLTLEAGPHDYWRGKFSIAAQNQEQSWLVYGNATQDGGYQADSGFDQQKLNIIQQTTLGQWEIKNSVAVSNLNQQTAGFIEGFEAYKDQGLRKTNANPEAFRNATSLLAYSQIKRINENHSVLTLSPYLRSNDMTFLQHYVPWQPVEKNGHNSVGLQASFTKQYDNIKLLSGFDWDQTWGELSEFQPDPFSATIPQGMHYDYAVTSRVYSPFFEANWQLAPSTKLVLGSRYEHTELDYNNHLRDGVACASDQVNCRFVRPADQRLVFRHWSHKLALNQQLSDDFAFYAQWSQGHRVPQTSELFRLQNNQSQSELKLEQSNSVEMGLRGYWLNAYMDLNGFYLKKDRVILQDTNRQIINNGSTSHRGLEFTLHKQLDAGFYIAAVATYAKHRYESALTISEQDISGNDIDTAPKHMGSAQLGWRSYEGQLVELEWLHMGQYYLDPENSAEYQGHDLLNLRMTIALSNTMTLGIRLLNITHQDYAERADIAFGNYRYFIGEPRSLFVSLNWTW